jgi:hypothetical protein
VRTPAQLEASRANGTRSHGPKTAEGKARSSKNATTHGLTARWLVLNAENPSGYDEVVAKLIAKFEPADEVELDFIEEMAVSYWRQRRAWVIESDTLNRQIEIQNEQNSVAGISTAFSALANNGKALSLLLLVRKEKLRNEPEPSAPPDVEPLPVEPSPVAENEPEAATPTDPLPAGRRLFVTARLRDRLLDDH